MAPSPVPPRLFVICASAADIAVVLRRGPTAWTHVIKWDLARDRLDHGAWIKGRLYGEKCDLSPDGSLFLYFVHDGKRFATSHTHAWTGVSRLPWVAALGLWPWGTTYGGGGRFTAERGVMLRAGAALLPHKDHPAHGLAVQFGDAPVHKPGTEVADAQWSGRDRHGNLLYARTGCLYRRKASGADKRVADLNGMVPDPRPAPAWATHPLR
jgi:hypothetical protein